MWSLADPWALLLLPLPFLAIRFLAPHRGGAGAMRVPDSIAAWLGKGEDGQIPGAAILRRILPALIWVLLVTALAGPQKLSTAEALPASSRDIMLVLDLSGSMEREDFAINGETATRLEVVKQVAADLVRSRAGDRVGLVVFAEEAFVAAPLNHDTEAVARTIETEAIGVAGRSTAISDGLGLALRRLDSSPAASKVVVLLSDGINNAGSVLPEDAGELARELGVRVHSIAFGPRDEQDGGDMRTVVDAATLRKVAENSGGEFFRVRNTEEMISVGDAIDRLEGSPTTALPVDIQDAFWTWPAGAALVLLVLHMISRRRQS